MLNACLRPNQYESHAKKYIAQIHCVARTKALKKKKSRVPPVNTITDIAVGKDKREKPGEFNNLFFFFKTPVISSV